jgi:Ca-activated chloride channel family protein
MHWEAAWCWLLLPPVGVYLWWLSRRSYAQLRPAARWGSLALRGLLVLLLIGAATRPTWLRPSDRRHVIFMLDVSRSISQENLDAALADIDRLARAATGARPAARVSVLAFGQRPTLLIRAQDTWTAWPDELRERLRYQATLPDLYAARTKLISTATPDDPQALAKIEARIAGIERFRDGVAGQHTDAESALRLALNCGDGGENRTLYLFTDGNFNQGEWQRACATVAPAGTRAHIVALDKPLPPEVAAADLTLPPSVRVNQAFSADLRVASTVATKAELRTYKDGFAEPPREVELRSGANVFRLPGLFFRDKGFHTIEVALRPAVDTRLENNTIRALVVVPGEARVLYVDGHEREMPYLKNALELEGMLVEARPANGVPQTLSELLSFDAFILSNVPADRLTLAQMQMIRTYVQDFGGGFLMLGGDESFGLGGYYNTPIEEILPVRMPIQKDLTRPSLALMLVIDKSGSMAGVKIQLAKRAALATAEAINPRDLIGLIGFDSADRVLLELTPAADRATVASHVSSLDAGGGTFLYPALEDAHQRLSESNARRKHVIVLSDGQTQGYGYEEYVSGMAADGITVSAVGIGDGADMRLLDGMASAGGGRAYFTNDFYSIPQIFTREALRASNSMLVERLVQPVPQAHDPTLNEIDAQELPLLTGYVATTAKPAGELILAADNGDPLLAKWRYGLGWTAAFTSEPKPRWAEDWIEWPDFAKFWSQLVRSLTANDLTQKLAIECGHRPDGAGVTLTADVRDTTGRFHDEMPELTAIGADGRPRTLPVVHRGAGLFEARVPEVTYGKDQQFVWRFPTRNESGSPDPTRTDPANAKEQLASYGFAYSFSPEFATLGPDADRLEQLAARMGGQVARVGESTLAFSAGQARTWRPLAPYLLIAALLLLPLDILVRRLG